MNNKRGIMLVECLVYIAIMLVALEFVYALYYDTNALIRINEKCAEQVDAARTFADSIRHDIRGCSEILPSFNNMTQSGNRLILSFPEKVTVYEFDNTEHIVKKIDIRGDERTVTGRWNCSRASFVMDRESPGTTLVSFVPAEKKTATLGGISVRARMRNGQ